MLNNINLLILLYLVIFDYRFTVLTLEIAEAMLIFAYANFRYALDEFSNAVIYGTHSDTYINTNVTPYRFFNRTNERTKLLPTFLNTKKGKNMKILKTLILLIFLSIFNITAYSNNYIDTFTNMKLGEKTTMIGDTLKTAGHVYFFLKPNECASCFSHMKAIFNMINTKYNIECVGFLSGLDQDATNEFKKNKKIEFTLLSDKINVYKDKYQIKFQPTYLVFDRSGHLIAGDKCGGVNISDEELLNIFEQLSEQTGKNIYSFPNLLEIERTTIKDNTGDLVHANKSHYLLRSKKEKSIVIVNVDNGEFLFVDSNSVLESKIKISDLKEHGFNSKQPLPISWIEENKSMLCCDIDKNWHFCFYKLDLRTKKTTEIIYDYPYPPYNASGAIYNPKNNTIVLALSKSTATRNPDYISEKANTIMILDTAGREISKTGKPEKLFQQYKISKIFTNDDLDIDINGILYELQSPTQTINVYTSDGSFLKSFELQVSETFKIVSQDLDSIGNIFINWKLWNSKASYCWDLKIDVENNELFFTYLNTNYTGESIEALEKEPKREMYLHKSDLDGNKMFRRDIQLPYKSLVISSLKDELILLERIENSFDIVKYKIVFD